MNTLVFDIETVPDLEAGRRLLGLDGLSEDDVGLAMMKLRRDETEGRSDFLKPHLHRVVAISVLLSSEGRIRLWSLGEPDAPESELIQRFFDGIERYTPVLVSWNGSGFDLPVLHYRGLFRGCVASRYFETGEHETSFRYNNYLSRFHWRHTDLMDVLAAYQARASASLNDTARLLGLPGKLDMDGSAVRERWLAGDIEGIRDYCETDVINTWLVYLAFQRLRGLISREEEQAGQATVRSYLEAESALGRLHLGEYLAAWPAA